jgi:hypothetical protein
MFLPKDLIHEIIEYGIWHTYVLCDWIDEKLLNMKYLCKNTHAIQYIEKQINSGIELKNFEMEELCKNKCQEAVELFEEYFINKPGMSDIEDLDFDCIYALSGNPFAIEIIKKHNAIKLITDDSNLYIKNPNAIEFIPKNINEKQLEKLCLNTNPEAIAMIKKSYIEKITQKCLSNLCYNTCSDAIDLVEKLMVNHVLDDDCIMNLCRNKNTKAINLIEYKLFDSLDEFEIPFLCSNPVAINLIERKILPIILKDIDNKESIDEEYKLDLIRGLCENPNALHLLNGVLSDYITYECIESLISNPNALDIIKDKFINQLSSYDYINLSENPSIFIDNRKKILTNILRMFN